jgi:excisionase family DNA binding protein
MGLPEVIETKAAAALLLKREFAAMRLGISLRTLDMLISTRQLKSVKIGKRRLITEASIQDFIRRAESKTH